MLHYCGKRNFSNLLVTIKNSTIRSQRVIACCLPILAGYEAKRCVVQGEIKLPHHSNFERANKDYETPKKNKKNIIVWGILYQKKVTQK